MTLKCISKFRLYPLISGKKRTEILFQISALALAVLYFCVCKRIYIYSISINAVILVFNCPISACE